MPIYNCIPRLSPFFLLLPPPAEAMSCGLINSALMGAQQDRGGVEGGWRLQVCGIWHSVTALSSRDKLETVHFPLTKLSSRHPAWAKDSGHYTETMTVYSLLSLQVGLSTALMT